MTENSAPHYSYGFYTEEELEQYYEELIGGFSSSLRDQTFDDGLDGTANTNYLDAVKFVAHLVWNEYQTKQAHSHPDQTSALVNLDVLNTVLLSLHPAELVEDMELSDYTRDGLAELHQLDLLILLEGHTGHDGQGARSEGHTGHHRHLQDWLHNLPTNYTAQLAIMGWFLTLTSKMTGFRMPGVGLAPGGLIHRARQEVELFLEDMETVADLMAERTNWNLPQYAILKEMHHDLKKMHYSFRHNRDQTSGQFRPMEEVDPKFPPERPDRRQFPDREEHERRRHL